MYNHRKPGLSGLGAASSTALTPQQTALLLKASDAFTKWKTFVLSAADRLESRDSASAGTVRNMVTSSGRLLGKVFEGDTSKLQVLESTMTNTKGLIAAAEPQGLPSLREWHDATVQSLKELVVSLGKTAGAAAGALIKAAADELDIKPADVGSGITTVAIAGAVIAVAVAIIWLKK